MKTVWQEVQVSPDSEDAETCLHPFKAGVLSLLLQHGAHSPTFINFRTAELQTTIYRNFLATQPVTMPPTLPITTCRFTYHSTHTVLILINCSQTILHSGAIFKM
jgi:hypothetical protein